MRKCEKCGASMKLDLRLKANGGGYGIVVRVDEKQKATTIDDVRVARQEDSISGVSHGSASSGSSI